MNNITKDQHRQIKFVLAKNKQTPGTWNEKQCTIYNSI